MVSLPEDVHGNLYCIFFLLFYVKGNRKKKIHISFPACTISSRKPVRKNCLSSGSYVT